MFSRILLAAIIIFLPIYAVVWAQGDGLIGSEGLQGEELISVAVSPADENVVYVGTVKGLYKKNISVKDEWAAVSGLPAGDCRVNQIIFEKDSYVATDKGLYQSELDTQAKIETCKNIFTKSNELENYCNSVCILGDGTVFIATKAGLFFKNKTEENWIKAGAPFESEEIISLYGTGEVVYAAVQSGIYKSVDIGKAWKKIFNVYSYGEAYESSTESEETEAIKVKHISGISGNPSVLYVATTQGVFLTKDAGKKWEQLSLAGMDAVNLRFIFVSPVREIPSYSTKFSNGVSSLQNQIFAVTKSGVYEFANNKWQIFVAAYDCKQMALAGENLILITVKDVFKYPFSSLKINELAVDDLMKEFDNEPSVGEVQKMAIAYAEVSNEKIKEWRRRANAKAFMPSFSLGYDKSITTSSGKFYTGPKSWDMNLSWDLAELVYSSDQTSIDTRSKLMVELRNDILAEATRLFFERRKLQMEVLSKNLSQEDIDKKLRLMELTALLDRLTGGNFSRGIIKVTSHR